MIRRELKVREKGPYSGVDLKRGVKNLNRLDCFEAVRVNDGPGSEEKTS